MAAVKATASNVIVSFGLISFPVDLVPAKESKTTKAANVSTKMVCPICPQPNPVSQMYMCGLEHGPFAKGELSTAIMVDGELRPATPEMVESLKAPDGVRAVMAVTVYPAHQVEAHTMASGNIYRLRARDNIEHYTLVRALAEDPKVAFLTEVTNKGTTKLYRLIVRDDLLVLIELVRPSEFHVPEAAPDAAFPAKLLATGRGLVEALTEDFDPATFADKRKARLLAMADVAAPDADDRDDRPAAKAAADLTELIRRSTEAA